MHFLVAIACLCAPGGDAPPKTVRVEVVDATGGLARVGAPVGVKLNLTETFGALVGPADIRLAEMADSAGNQLGAVPVQWVPDEPKAGTARKPVGNASGTVWFLMPPGQQGTRRFVLTAAGADAPRASALTVKKEAGDQRYDISEGKDPVLRYNFGTVAVPPGTPPHFAKGESYERGDYISPLYGLSGEILTDDYPKDHAHHRGVWWSWPVTRWHDEVFDIWAVVGVHARPVAVKRAEGGPVLAVIQAENVWKWKDREPIVREEVLIRAFRSAGKGRAVDVEVRLTGLADEVFIGGRPKRGYGGFTLRAAPCEERTITPHTEPADTEPRRAWLDYSGVFAGAAGVSGVAILEHVSNPDYPNPLHQYPGCNCVMPAYPATREAPLPKGKTLVLKHRLWIHPGGADARQLADVWDAYAHPPKVRVAD